MFRLRADALRVFARHTRASASIELGIGAAVLLSVAMLCFDLYARVEADTVGGRLAVTMADYVSRGPDTDAGTLDGSALSALGAFLHARELGTADLVFVVTALRQPTDTQAAAVEILWSDDALRFGDENVTGELALDCARFVGESAGQTVATLPDGFAMSGGEVLVVVELCARLRGSGSFTGRFVAGDIYRHHVLPVRDPEKAPPAPVHVRQARGDGRAGDARASG